MHFLTHKKLGILPELLVLAILGWALSGSIGGMGTSIANIAQLPVLASMAVAGLYFAVRLIVKLVLLSKESRAASVEPTPNPADRTADGSSFDVDAALARYMHRRGAEPSAPDAENGLPSVAPSNGRGFGRKRH